ncbi:helix-turn-helix domain-containing protein [Bacillus sp. FJAT-27916]|uniref:helix-turn-helix domain-containing protein n=1 Tax=Bacillus sp. FJAT-27916 TaxID=1679169 RepID=UPI0009E46C6C|nr:helix-turn-helix transcriptional regulator [Bacillus sp. FJAT-27916]
MDNDFGSKLKTLREERKWSQDELAKELNMSRQAVYKWESGRGYPDIQNLIRISDLFGVTVDDLIRNDKKLQDQISIKEEVSIEQFGDPGFYLGMILVFVGIFTSNDSLSTIVMIIGLLTICFFTDAVKSIKSLFKRNLIYGWVIKRERELEDGVQLVFVSWGNKGLCLYFN